MEWPARGSLYSPTCMCRSEQWAEPASASAASFPHCWVEFQVYTQCARDSVTSGNVTSQNPLSTIFLHVLDTNHISCPQRMPCILLFSLVSLASHWSWTSEWSVLTLNPVNPFWAQEGNIFTGYTRATGMRDEGLNSLMRKRNADLEANIFQ